MHWLKAIERLRASGSAGVLVTLTEVRGHAPQSAGAKLVVSADGAWGTVGGGNLEASAIDRARELLAAESPSPESRSFELNEHAHNQHGTQCCGGVVTVLFEPLRPPPSIAIFGMGHVGIELAVILARHDVRLHLVDTRPEHAVLPVQIGQDPTAEIHVHHAPVPEVCLGTLPPGTHVLILTHDHAEDIALCDAALRSGHLRSIGLIGSSAKWRRFEQRLAAEGHSPSAIAAIRAPIGDPTIAGKDPATVALSATVGLLKIVAQQGVSSPSGRS